MDWGKWVDENAVNREHKYFNGIHYVFATLKDSWIAIFEVDLGRWIPCIQADNMNHAESWCSLREPITVPVQELVPREREW